MAAKDPYYLERFVDAQRGVYEQVLRELRAGEKQSHWMWFIFPQIKGLGSSPTAQRYAITSLEEAGAYLAHAVLGARLRECTALVHAVQGRSLGALFGSPDDMKFHSSVTMFALAENDEDSVFKQALGRYFGAKQDNATIAILQRQQ